MTDPCRYWAFISYSHADLTGEAGMWINWLDQGLRSFQVPEACRPARHESGLAVRGGLRHIFRDRSNLGARENLWDSLKSSLLASWSLVVVCSPAASGSDYMDQEIRAFRSRPGRGPVLCVVLGFEPDPDGRANPRAWLPPALRDLEDEPVLLRLCGPDGSPVPFRGGGAPARGLPEPPSRVLAGLVAGILGVDKIALTREHELGEERREQEQRQAVQRESKRALLAHRQVAGMLDRLLDDLSHTLEDVGRSDALVRVLPDFIRYLDETVGEDVTPEMLDQRVHLRGRMAGLLARFPGAWAALRPEGNERAPRPPAGEAATRLVHDAFRDLARLNSLEGAARHSLQGGMGRAYLFQTMAQIHTADERHPDAMRAYLRAVAELEPLARRGQDPQHWDRMAILWHSLANGRCASLVWRLRWMRRARGCIRRLRRLQPQGTRWQVAEIRTRLAQLDLRVRQQPRRETLRGLRLHRIGQVMAAWLEAQMAANPRLNLSHLRMLVGAEEVVLGCRIQWRLHLEDFLEVLGSYQRHVETLCRLEPGAVEWELKRGIVHTFASDWGQCRGDPRMTMLGKSRNVDAFSRLLQRPGFRSDRRVVRDFLLVLGDARTHWARLGPRVEGCSEAENEGIAAALRNGEALARTLPFALDAGHELIEVRASPPGPPARRPESA